VSDRAFWILFLACLAGAVFLELVVAPGTVGP